MAQLALETTRVPVGVHRLDDTPNDELTALDAAGRKEDMKVMFAVLAALELVEDGILGEWTEALGADKAVLVPDFAACIDNLFPLFEAFLAP